MGVGIEIGIGVITVLIARREGGDRVVSTRLVMWGRAIEESTVFMRGRMSRCQWEGNKV